MKNTTQNAAQKGKPGRPPGKYRRIKYCTTLRPEAIEALRARAAVSGMTHGEALEGLLLG